MAGIYNAACLTKKQGGKLFFKVVFDTSIKGDKVQIKNAGGMQQPQDLEFESWIEIIEYLLRENNFSQEQIESIISYETEYQDTRDPDFRNLLREILEEIGIYIFRASKFIDRPITYESDGKTINQKFWMVSEYIPSSGLSTKSKDKDVLGSSWVQVVELLSSDGPNKIVKSHTNVIKAAFKLNRISQEISIKRLKDF